MTDRTEQTNRIEQIEQKEAAFNEGHLRAYLDNELSAAECAVVEAKLAESPKARQQLTTLQACAEQVHAALDTSAATPDTQAAWHHIQTAIVAHPVTIALDKQNHQNDQNYQSQRRKQMNNSFRSWLGNHRALAASIAVLVVMLGLLTLPPVRTLADQLLQVFRVQEVVFVPISEERIAELENLDFDGSTLFVGEPEVIQDAGEPYTVADVAAAAAATGYPVHTPAELPEDVALNEVSVLDPSTVSVQVNTEAAQQLLDLLAITDVTIPAELGDQPITVASSSLAMLDYTGNEQEIELVQGYSPEVTLPENVNLQQLGHALLRLLGMEEQQAATLSQQINWSTTLIVPIPSDIDTLQQVTINGADGLLIRGYDDSNEGTHWQLYWQQSDRFYVLIGHGSLGSEEIINLATSVR